MAGHHEQVHVTTGASTVVATPTTLRSGTFLRIKHLLAPWRRKPIGVVGGIMFGAVVIVAAAAPWIAPYPPGMFVGLPLEGPNSKHLLGTNNLGQDVLSRTIFGAQISIAVGLTATVLATITGTLLGILSGFFGGWVDMLIQRGLEVLGAFPGLVLALIVISALGRPKESGSNIILLAWHLKTLSFAIALPLIFGVTRIIRSVILVERNTAYIEAARCIGAGSVQVITRHLLPNVLPYTIVAFSTIISVCILVEAALSFLGYGVSVGTPSWGIDLSNRNREYFVQAPWLIIGPGVSLSVTVLAVNYWGDALRDILDPRLRGR